MAGNDDDLSGRHRFPVSPRDAHLYVSDEDDEKRLRQLLALPEETMTLLGELRPEEVETIRTLSRLDQEERDLVFQSIKLTKSIRTTGWFVKWLAVGVLGIFVTFNLLAEQIMKAIQFFQNGGPK